MTGYTHIIDLAKEVAPPDDGILTRTLFNDDQVNPHAYAAAIAEEVKCDSLPILHTLDEVLFFLPCQCLDCQLPL